jgi:hypothetical protein
MILFERFKFISIAKAIELWGELQVKLQLFHTSFQLPNTSLHPLTPTPRQCLQLQIIRFTMETPGEFNRQTSREEFIEFIFVALIVGFRAFP